MSVSSSLINSFHHIQVLTGYDKNVTKNNTTDYTNTDHLEMTL